MSIKALILDLDNTVFPVPSIGDELFQPLFDLIRERNDYEGDFEDIKRDMMRKPFQKVAKEYAFSEQLTEKGDRILQDLVYEKDIPPFPDFAEVRALPYKRFLVTTGYTKMQQSKVENLGIREYFEEVHIVDPSKTNQTKKDIFQSILERYKYKTTEVMVIGDDPESELKAGRELGIRTVLYTKDGAFSSGASHSIVDFGQLKELIAQNKV
ncbi:HAD family hydrolase [Pontibacter anaerobius]|uniref:HAD family hydrolase n=1 Tax=Pontibacter anaerobius TaxID=2993940 RepID=A0ABT3RD02_9BACT|nr:HAD family hydrolase [Pontibacter anaerobius]MCX2739329.1 HAD family hydrolase [Pontibacter anaerobius]